MAQGTIAVKGLRELNRAFALADVALKTELRDGLREAAEPVRRSAEQLAGTQIRNMRAGAPWTRMRVGVTAPFVYVAPVQRSTRNPRLRRRNLASLLIERAMEPALNLNEAQVVSGVEHVLDTVARTWEHA